MDNNDQITFDIFTPYDFGRNFPNSSSFAGIQQKWAKTPSLRAEGDSLARSTLEKQTPNKKRFFKFENTKASSIGMSFGKNNLIGNRESSSRVTTRNK